MMESSDGSTHGWKHFNIELRHDPQQIRVVVSGELDLATATALDQVLHHSERENLGLCIDLEGLNFIDAVGLAVIYRAWRTAEKTGRQLTVRGCSRQVEQLFTLTGMRGLLPFED